MLKNGRNGRKEETEMTIGDKRLGDAFDASARPFITVDVRKYQDLLDESNMSDEQKEEFLQALWSIVVTFVELGFGVNPMQEVCGKDSAGISKRPKEAFDKVRSNEIDQTTKQEDSSPLGGLEV